MDALEFLRERKRMCNLRKHCEGCPLERDGCGLGTSTPDEEYEKFIATVEQWSKEHPIKTRQSVFLKQFPKAELDVSGVITICPAPPRRIIETTTEGASIRVSRALTAAESFGARR